MEITVLMLAISTSYHVNGHSHTAYNYDCGGLGTNSDWQARHDDSLRINKVSYPGTHDTMADDNDAQAVGMSIHFVLMSVDVTITKLLIYRLSSRDIDKTIRSWYTSFRYSL